MNMKAEQGVPPLRATSGARVNADVGTMMKWIIISIWSAWGILEIPLFPLIKATRDYNLSMLHDGLQIFVVGTHLVWFMPAFWIAHLFGLGNQLYDAEILICPKGLVGWLLPVVFWFIVSTLLVTLLHRIKIAVCQKK